MFGEITYPRDLSRAIEIARDLKEAMKEMHNVRERQKRAVNLGFCFQGGGTIVPRMFSTRLKLP